MTTIPEICKCKYTGSGEPMDNTECTIHVEPEYSCDRCECDNYRPVSFPDTSKGYWPKCVCGHIAQEHNGEKVWG